MPVLVLSYGGRLRCLSGQSSAKSPSLTLWIGLGVFRAETLRGQEPALMAVVPMERGGSGIADVDLTNAGLLQAKRFGGRHRQVENSIARERTAVINPHKNGSIGLARGHIGITWHGQRPVRRRQSMHVKNFAIGRLAAMEVSAVPGRHPGFLVVRFFLWMIPPPGDLVGLADLVDAAALRQTLSLAPVIPVIILDDISKARPLAEALVAGGLPDIS